MAERLESMLSKYSGMCDGSLGEITTVEHRIELVPGNKAYSPRALPGRP